jgi:hypothetical protein
MGNTLKVSISLPIKVKLESFKEWLMLIAKDKAHEAHKDIIADFIDKVFLFEAKKVVESKETYDLDVEIPSSVISDPILKAYKGFDKEFRRILKENNIIVPAEKEEETPAAEAVKNEPEPDAEYTPRNGNGHKVEKKRNLTNPERDMIRAEFMQVKCMIYEDACVEMYNRIKTTLPNSLELAIFQVTGFVSYLHAQIAEGKLIPPDIDLYKTWLQGKRELYATYNSPKYIELRRKLGIQS